MPVLVRATLIASVLASAFPAFAQKPKTPVNVVKSPVAAATIAPPRPATSRMQSVGFPQDAGPHDEANIEWWYFNSFFTTKSGRRFAVIGSFFRTGLTPRSKGHYLLYALMDLDKNRRAAHSVLDRSEIGLLRSLTQFVATSRPDDPKPLQLLAYLQRGTAPPPHRALTENAVLRVNPRFSIAFQENTLSQESDDGRTWHATLVGDKEAGDDWELELTLTQPPDKRPAMLVGGKGMTGVKRPDEMYYLTLSRMEASGTLTLEGEVNTVSGTGWLDRQWGSPAFVSTYGWDWLGAQLDDGSDLLLFRIRDLKTGSSVKTEATILRPDGTQIVEKPTLIKSLGTWTDERTNTTFPSGFEVTLPVSGYKLSFAPAFADQTIPVIGIGDAIWEGAVTVTGTKTEAGPNTILPGQPAVPTDKASPVATSGEKTPSAPEGKGEPAPAKEIHGTGFMELVGYKSRPRPAGAKGTAKPAPATETNEDKPR